MFRSLFSLGLLLALPYASIVWAQQSVSVLRTLGENGTAGILNVGEQNFDLQRGLIYFEASIDGRRGNFILDTGAPRLLVNDRGQPMGQPQPAGVGLDGTVELGNRRVNSFRMAGRDHGKHWAYTLDLRPMERRTDTRIDGFVGYELLRNGEVRIDYPARNFALLESSRRPRHEGRAPRHTFRFHYVNHLPAIELRINGKRRLFVIDTGAGSNLVEASAADELFAETGETINLQGLGGRAADHAVTLMEPVEELALNERQRRFVSMDLAHLDLRADYPVVGLLGADFLTGYTVGIDYRRRRVYLW